MRTVRTIEEWNELLNEMNSGDNDLLYSIGSYLDDGLEINGEVIIYQNESEAFNVFKKAYENGHPDAMIRLAGYYSEGKVCPKNIELAIELYQKGIENGDSLAANNLATVYRDLGNYSKAFELYQLSQQLGSSASIRLAYCYYYGVGTPMDKSEAFKIFERIVSNLPGESYSGYELDDANYYLGMLYLEGLVVEKSIDKARFYLERADVDKDNRMAHEALLIIGRR